MLVSLRWLQDYIDINEDPGVIAEKLTMAGLEVEAINDVSPGFSRVIVATITDIHPHPNADKLSLCDVRAGEESYSVVCGATNIQAGQRVPLAQVGAVIPGGYIIKRSKLRGIESEGMLCSEDELGIGDDASGIMILPDTLREGDDLAAALDLKDTVFDISITPNRSDCLSIIGIAREIAAITGQKVRYPSLDVDETEESVHDVTSVDIVDSDLCPRYTARIIKNVSIKPAPAWMRIRLEAVGLRAINNVVDITNFVMMEMGQPLHAFDYRHLEEGRIVVRGATEGEKFVSLDGKPRILGKDTLMICDGVKPVAVAGIMGGLNSEVADDTETVLLESAYFNPASIRRSARALAMPTDASFRFERGVDPEGVVRAQNRAAQLIAHCGGGSICRGYVDTYPKKLVPVDDIPLKTQTVNEVLGTDMTPDAVSSILERLEMAVTEEADGAFLVTPPSFRVDIAREIDLVEEVARLSGYDTIPLSLPSLSGNLDVESKKRRIIRDLRNALTGSGYTEAINYSFTTPESAHVLGFGNDDAERRFTAIQNPLGEEQSVMRTTLAYGLLAAMKKNYNVGNRNLKMFEIGRTFFRTEGAELPTEREKLGMVLTGLRYDDSWHAPDVYGDFYDLKGALENILSAVNARDISFETADTAPYLNSGRSGAVMAGDRNIGVIGEVHPDVMETMELKQAAYICELDLQELIEYAIDGVSYTEVTRFPSISRDVAYLVPHTVHCGDIETIIRAHGGDFLENVQVFDVYSGKGIPDGMKSMAFRLTYRSRERTLTDDDIVSEHDRIVTAVVKGAGAKVRGVE